MKGFRWLAAICWMAAGVCLANSVWVSVRPDRADNLIAAILAVAAAIGVTEFTEDDKKP
jgi:hypothetical protein